MSIVYFKGVTCHFLNKIIYFCLWRFFSSQTVQNLMKCHLMWHFIWILTVCKRTCLPVFKMERVNTLTKSCSQSFSLNVLGNSCVRLDNLCMTLRSRFLWSPSISNRGLIALCTTSKTMWPPLMNWKTNRQVDILVLIAYALSCFFNLHVIINSEHKSKNFGHSLHLHYVCVRASSEGCGNTAQMCRFVKVFTACISTYNLLYVPTLCVQAAKTMVWHFICRGSFEHCCSHMH